MMRSLYSGVAGLRTHQTKMDVIGNNIANVNTTSFKASSIVFSELMSQTTQRASGPNAARGTGGVNARQIGLGVKSGAININITGQGATQSTGNPFDVMITGENFFVVTDGLQHFFTRDGSFYVDGAGNLAMTSTGYNVMGWQVDETTGDIKQDTVSALRIMSAANMTYPPEATSLATMSGIIDKHDTDVTSANGKVVNLNFFDAVGYEYTARFVFRQSGDVNEYSLELEKILDSTGKEVTTDSQGNPIDIEALFGAVDSTQLKPGKVARNTEYEWNVDGKKLERNGKTVVDLEKLFEGGKLKELDAEVTLENAEDGKENTTVGEQLDVLASVYGYEGSTEDFLNLLVSKEDGTNVSIEEILGDMSQNGVNGGPDITQESFDTVGRYFTGITVVFDGDTGKFAGVNGQATSLTSVLHLSNLGGNFSDITIDFSETSMYNNKGTSTIGADKGDANGYGTGRRLGDMIGVSIQQDGRIYASYDNGMTRLLGQIATAAFANASGLEKSGDNLYAATLNSGEFDGVGVDITANGGYMTTGQLEMSNVDLSAEFTEMITTQRGFQANSRIITVSDTLLEELTNLKR